MRTLDLIQLNMHTRLTKSDTSTRVQLMLSLCMCDMFMFVINVKHFHRVSFNYFSHGEILEPYVLDEAGYLFPCPSPAKVNTARPQSVTNDF